MILRLRGRADHVALVAAQFASAAGSLLLLLVTAWALGPTGRGIFAFFLLWPTLGAYLLAFGIPGANLKFAAEDERGVQALVFNTGLVAATVGAVLALPLILGAPDWLAGPMPSDVMWLAWAATVIMVCFHGWTWVLMGLGKFVEPSILKGVFPGLAAVIFGLLALTGLPGGTSVAAACGLYLAAAGAVTVWVLARLIALHGRPRPDRYALRRSLVFGMRYQLGLVSQMVTFRADQWILGVVAAPAALAVYSIAASVSEVATYASTAHGMTRFREAAQRRAGPAAVLIITVTVITAVSALIVAVAAIVLIRPVFGEEFSDAVKLTLILLTGVVGIGLTRVVGNELAGSGRPGIFSAISLVQAAVMVAAFVAVIPDHGAEGAAVVSAGGYLLGGAACSVALWHGQRTARNAGAEAVTTL